MADLRIDVKEVDFGHGNTRKHTELKTRAFRLGNYMETPGLEHEDLTFRIRACVYEVFRVLGAGFLEQVYQQALMHELELQGLRAEGQRTLEVTYKGKTVGLYVADILVEDCVVLELKAAGSLTKAHEAQLLNYLKASGKKIGLLVNFTHPKAEIRRFVL